LLDLFPGACSVLEVGAGTGHFTRWLSDEGWAAAGLDRSASMLWQARRLDESQLVQGDALRLPFREDAFDLVAFITVLEFVEQRRDVLLEALRVARHGLVLGILNRCSVLGLQRRLTSLFRRTTYDEARFPSVPEMKRLLKSVADDGARIVWHTTLLPRCCSWSPARLPWGAFIAMALVA
jgi:ubiquinone/menaquinone biosynthesis C-methylase UbiE